MLKTTPDIAIDDLNTSEDKFTSAVATPANDLILVEELNEKIKEVSFYTHKNIQIIHF